MKRTPSLLILAVLLQGIPASAQASLALWSAPAMERISRTTPPRSADVVQLSAARNEWEAVQLIIWAEATVHAQTAFTISPFTNEEGAMLPPAQLYQEGYVKVTTPSPHSPLGAGEYADALIPAAAAKPCFTALQGAYNQPWWLDQYIPADAAAGHYYARATCHSDEGDRSIDLALTVWPITLPARSTLRSTFGAHWGRIAEIHHLPAITNSTTLRSKVTAYQQLLAAHRLTPEPMYPELDIAPDGTLRSLPLAELQTYFNELQATSFPLPICAQWPFKDPLGKHRSAAVRYLATFMKEMQRQGWAGECFVDCPIDEPASAAAYEQVRGWGKLCHEAEERCGLRIPLLCTIAPKPHEQWGSLIGAVDIWVPCVGDIWLDHTGPISALQQRQAEGEPVWAYTAMVNFPKTFVHGKTGNAFDHHPPTWLIDFAPMNYRIMAWQCAANNWQGLLYWDTVHWADGSDPWQDPGTFTEPGATYNGDGCLLYPSAQGPVASLRLKWLRESMEDHCLIQMARAAGLTTLTNTEVRSIARNIADWDASPTALMAARLRLGEALAAQQTQRTTNR